MADQLNNLLAAGGTVVVSTYCRATQYSRKHAGWFRQTADGNLEVRHGRGWNRLTANGGKMLLVKIQTAQPIGA